MEIKSVCRAWRLKEKMYNQYINVKSFFKVRKEDILGGVKCSFIFDAGRRGLMPFKDSSLETW